MRRVGTECVVNQCLRLHNKSLLGGWRDGSVDELLVPIVRTEVWIPPPT
ncbi:rCG29673 [Rattus norvegicus]|uniref:RCG29673 n=1 Tax=Rattus norvegicus TaxID=10116 RepID=A6IMC9_RAT|nr:rCG29673 [Rattus norvegicus]